MTWLRCCFLCISYLETHTRHVRLLWWFIPEWLYHSNLSIVKRVVLSKHDAENDSSEVKASSWGLFGLFVQHYVTAAMKLIQSDYFPWNHSEPQFKWLHAIELLIPTNPTMHCEINVLVRPCKGWGNTSCNFAMRPSFRHSPAMITLNTNHIHTTDA